jgi:hypothetical protein
MSISEANLDALAERFCACPLPEGVAADLCATDPSYPHQRMGTNLLSVAQAKEVLRFTLSGFPLHDGEQRLREWRDSDPEAAPDGTLESLAGCATMLETYGPECFPANEKGQVAFERCMMDSTAAEIRAFLAAFQEAGERERVAS